MTTISIGDRQRWLEALKHASSNKETPEEERQRKDGEEIVKLLSVANSLQEIAKEEKTELLEATYNTLIQDLRQTNAEEKLNRGTDDQQDSKTNEVQIEAATNETEYKAINTGRTLLHMASELGHLDLVPN